jgi:hypothetical protein
MQGEDTIQAVATSQKKQRKTKTQETRPPYLGEIGTLDYCGNQAVRPGLPHYPNPAQCQDSGYAWACAPFLPTSTSSYNCTGTHPNTDCSTMVQFYKQPLEFFSKQHHAYSSSFKAIPFTNPVNPFTQISTVPNNPSQMTNPFQKNKHSHTT